MLRDRRGSVTPLMTLLVIPMIAAIGIATESAGWFMMQRAAQNAADAAVLAAASNGNVSPATPSYDQEAKSVAANYGFNNGVDNATVTASYPVTCPSGAVTCYRVTVKRKIPIALANMVGYRGSTTINGNSAVQIGATAVASKPIQQPYCITVMAHGMASTDVAFELKGAPKADFRNCGIFSNASVDCTGQSGSTIGVATTVDSSPKKPCGTSNGGATPLTSGPYDGLASKIPTTGCQGFATLGGLVDWSSYSCVKYTGTGTVPVTSSTTIKTKTGGTLMILPSGTTLNVPSGMTVRTGTSTNLATSGFDSTTGLTIVFNGTNFFGGGSGTLDFAAPTSGDWSGVAVYQNTTTLNNYTYAGNAPTWNITGVINATYMNLEVDGAVNKQSGGYACSQYIVNSITSKGTGYLFSTNPQSQCHLAGADPVSGVPNSVAVRQGLVG